MDRVERLKQSISKWLIALAIRMITPIVPLLYRVIRSRFIARDSPAEIQFVTDDIERFWRAFDLAQNAQNPAEVFQREYLDRASPGLRHSYKFAFRDAKTLAGVVQDHPKYYRAIRQTTLSIARDDTVRAKILRNFEQIKVIYPQAKFQDMYFAIGGLSCGGTANEMGLYLGVEMNTRSTDTPTDELSDWLRQNIGPLEDLPFLVTHELVHSLQVFANSGSDLGKNLLWKVINEGAADFVAALASNEKPRGAYFKYGIEHEPELWPEFSKVMRGSDWSAWLYNGDESKGRPADLGYFIGHRIVEAYYERSSDKRRALEEIIAMRNPEAILEASGYGRLF